MHFVAFRGHQCDINVTFNVDDVRCELIAAYKSCDWLADAKIITLLIFVTRDKEKKC